MSHSVRRHLRVEIDGYDEVIRRFIPGYEEMLSAAADAVEAVRPARVLDLGAGTGALSAALLARPTVGTVELLDADAEMLAKARERLAAHGERVRFRHGTFDDPLPPCGAVAASLALHHIPTLDAKRVLYRRIHDALEPGGVFVNADATVPGSGAPRDEAFAAWADHMVDAGIERTQAYRHFEEWAEEDTYFPLEAELAALAETGLGASCVWRRGPMSVVVGRKGS